MYKRRNKHLTDDDRWKTKGGPHRCPIPHPEKCPACGGTGWLDYFEVTFHALCDEDRCPTCDGTGEVWK